LALPQAALIPHVTYQPAIFEFYTAYGAHKRGN